ncbi:hypothetical protein EV702DRAFT_981720, partial [Suillus placidus]
YLNKKDAKSTGNMQKHVKSCWGEAALQTAMEYRYMLKLRRTDICSTKRPITSFKPNILQMPQSTKKKRKRTDSNIFLSLNVLVLSMPPKTFLCRISRFRSLRKGIM